MSDSLCFHAESESVCKICTSLNYTRDIQLKPKEEIGKPFNLSRMPVLLLDQVIVKMDTKSFARMRSTNKEYSEYIEKHREKLRIALFHTMTVSTCSRFRTEPFILFQYAGKIEKAHSEKNFNSEEIYRYYNTSINTDFGEFKDAVKVIMTQTAQPTRYGGRRASEVTFRSPQLAISLRQWKRNPAFRRELIGVFHNNYFSMTRYQEDQIYDEETDLLTAFMKSARISKMNLRYGNPERRILQEIKPDSLKLCFTDLNNIHFLKKEGYENVRHLSVSSYRFKLYIEDLKNIETLTVHEGRTPQPTVLILLKRWIAGSLKIKEFCLATKSDISLQSLDLLPIHKSKTWKYCRSYMFYDKWRTTRKLRAFRLEQNGTEKKAVCIVTDQFTRFKVITTDN